MHFYGKAAESAQRILELFKTGNVPTALAPIFIRRDDDAPCRRWSWRNQLLTALSGFHDARGFRQWQEVGRHVRKGERAFHILVPLSKTVSETDDAGNKSRRSFVYGFKGAAVFGLEQTDGEALPGLDVETQRFMDALPLLSVARSWALSVTAYNGKGARALGFYKHGQAIALGVQNVATWAHELVHAADDRRGKLSGSSKLSREVVAELGGAVLLACLGRESDADYGGCWEYVTSYAKREDKEPVTVCERLLSRTCEAVALILKTADELVAAESVVAA